MSEPDAWDDEDFEPQDADGQKAAATATDKWDGEDEDDDLKDNWDDEESSEKSAEPSEGGEAFQKKKKRPLKDRIAEKEAKKKAELEEKRLKEEEERKNMNPQELLADKLRRQKLQEEADLKLARETFGITDDPTQGIDACAPVTKDEFDQFGKLLKEKLTKYTTSIHYVPLLENLFRDVTIDLEPEDIKKLGSTLSTLCNEKVKAQKGKTKKKKGAKLVVSKNTEDLESYDYAADYDDFI